MIDPMFKVAGSAFALLNAQEVEEMDVSADQVSSKAWGTENEEQARESAQSLTLAIV